MTEPESYTPDLEVAIVEDLYERDCYIGGYARYSVRIDGPRVMLSVGVIEGASVDCPLELAEVDVLIEALVLAKVAARSRARRGL